MKTFLNHIVSSIFALLLLPTAMQAQVCGNWFLDVKSLGSSSVTGLVEADQGKMVYVGYFVADTINLELTDINTQQLIDTDLATSAPLALQSLFVSQKSNGPDEIDWVTIFNGTGENEIIDVAFKNGAIYITGYFLGQLDFNGTVFTSQGVRDGFVAKLDGNGSVVWAKQISGSQWETGIGLAVDDNNVYVAGYYMNGADFGGTNLSAINNTEAFVASYNTTTGGLSWVKGFIGSAGKDEVIGIDMDTSGNLYISGFTEGDFSIGSFILSSNGLRDVYVAQLDTLGNVAWANAIGGSAWEAPGDLLYNIFDNSLYIGGIWTSSTIVLLGDTFINAGGHDAFIAKYKVQYLW